MTRIVLFVSLLLTVNQAATFEFTGHKYSAGSVQFQLGDLCDSARFPLTPGICTGDETNPDWEAEFVTALERWNTATDFFQWTTDSGIGASIPGDCDSSDPNSAFFLDDVCGSAFGGSTLAVARTFFGPDGEAVHSDIIFNTAKTWGAFDDSLALHPGISDFRRVAVHEQGHVMGLDHPYHNDAIMYFASQDVTDPQANDLAALKALYGATTFITSVDFSGNGKQELVLLRSLDDGATKAEIRDSASGAIVGPDTTIILPNTFTPVNCVMLPDLDGDSSIEIATLATRNSDGRAVVRIQNVSGPAATRTIWLPNNSTPVKMIGVPDADNNGFDEVAVLMTRDSDSRTFVEIRNAFDTEAPKKLWYLRFSTPLDMTLVADADKNMVPEIAVLSSRFQDNRGVVEVKNAFGAIQTNQVWVSSGFSAMKVVSLNDADDDVNNVPEVAVLSTRNSDGRILVEVQNAAGTANRNKLWFTAGQSPRALAAVSDGDKNGVDEVAVLSRRISDGRILVQTKNGAGATLTQSLWYSPGFAPLSTVSPVNDSDGNTVLESAILMSRTTDARLVIQQQNITPPAATSTIWISP